MDERSECSRVAHRVLDEVARRQRRLAHHFRAEVHAAAHLELAAVTHVAPLMDLRGLLRRADDRGGSVRRLHPVLPVQSVTGDGECGVVPPVTVHEQHVAESVAGEPDGHLDAEIDEGAPR